MTDRTVSVGLKLNVSDFVAKSKLAGAAVKDLNREIDKSNDRTAWLAQGVLALTPAVTRLGAGAVPALSGMATQMMLTVAAAGTMALAFNGVGDALGALNDYQLDPTSENLKQLNDAMAKIGPSGQAMVEFLDSLSPALEQMSNSARNGAFPGMIDGIREFMTLAPQVNDIISEIAGAMGQLTAEAGAGLSGDRFADFFDYLEVTAKPVLVEMGRTLGNFTDGLLNMLVAFDPLTRSFSSGLLEMSRSFARWSDGLESSAGFQEFVAYVQDAAPQTLDFLGSMAMLFADLAEAAAPVGAVLLPMLTGLLNVLGDLANTPLGPLAIGFLSLTSVLGRVQALMAITGSGALPKLTAGLRGNAAATKAAIPSLRQFGSAAAFAMTSTDALVKSSFSYSQAANKSAFSALQARNQVKEFGRAAAPIAGQVGLLALAMSDYDDKLGLTNTTSLALAGTLFGPWGTAVGASAGLLLDMRSAADEATKGIEGLDAAIASGNLDTLGTKIAEAKKELADQDKVTGFGDFFSDTMRDLTTGGAGTDVIDIYTEKIKLSEAELVKLKNARQDSADDDALYNSLQAETRALEANIEAMRAKRAEAIRGLNAELDYKASILDAKEALKENGKTVDKNTREGQANLRTLYGMASAFNAQGDAAKDSAAEVRAGREQFVNIAVAMGMGEDAARRLAKRLYELPAKVPIEIGVDHETAMAHVRAVKAELASIDKSIDIYVNVHKPTNSGLGGAQIGSADGSTVPGQRYPYGDKIHAMVAPGEEIISNRYGQADKNRAALKAANAGAKIAVVGYAGGGTAGRTAAPTGGSGGGFSGFGGPGRQTSTSLENISKLQVESIRMLSKAAARQLAAAEAQVDAATEQEAAAQAQVDGTKALMSSLASATTSGFQTDLFAKDSNVWGAGSGGGWFKNLSTDISGLQKRGDLQAQLGLAGLDGDALIAALSQASGPDGNAQLQSLLDSGRVQEFEDLFNQRAALTTSVGGAAANQVYGAQLAGQNAALSQAAAGVSAINTTVANLSATVDRLEKQAERRDRQAERREAAAEARAERQADRTGEAVGAAINGAAANGHRGGRGR